MKRFDFLLVFILIINIPAMLFAQPRIHVEPREIGPFVEEFNEQLLNIENVGDEPLEFHIEINFGEHPEGWIATDPEEAVIDQFGDLDLFVFVDLRDLLGGQYEAVIHILSNDPDDGDITILVTAEVESIPWIEVQWEEWFGYPDLIDWNLAFDREPLYTGATYSVPVTILNEGNDNLRVFIIRSPNPFFRAQPDQFDLEAGAALQVEFLFAAIAVGQFESEMVVSSNGANQAEIRIPITAESVDPPVFEIPLDFGWNMISAPVRPMQRDVPILFNELNDNGSLILVKDQYGNFYIPEFDFNNIPFWDHLQGYLVKVSQPERLEIRGSPLPDDEPIGLEQGWNIVAYLPEAEIRAPAAFWNIEDELILAKDDRGNFYSPAFEFNNLPPLRRGRGYLVKVSRAIEFVWYNLSPARLELEPSGRHQRGEDETWRLGVVVTVFDDGGNPFQNEVPVDFIVEPDDVVVDPVRTRDGFAETWLTFSAERTLETVRVTARAEAVDGRIEESIEVVLPLFEGQLDLNIEPLVWEFDRERPNEVCNIQIRAQLLDGFDNPINNAVILFETSRGRFHWFDRQQDRFIAFDDGEARLLTGVRDERREEEPGCATVFLRGVMDDFFLDPFTLEVCVEVQAQFEESNLESDPGFIFIRRNRN